MRLLTGSRVTSRHSSWQIGECLDSTARDILVDMKRVSISLSEAEYEAFREASRKSGRSIAQLVREAMTFYREERLQPRTRLRGVPVLPGHRPLGELPPRAELYEEAFRDHTAAGR